MAFALLNPRNIFSHLVLSVVLDTVVSLPELLFPWIPWPHSPGFPPTSLATSQFLLQAHLLIPFAIKYWHYLKLSLRLSSPLSILFLCDAIHIHWYNYYLNTNSFQICISNPICPLNSRLVYLIPDLTSHVFLKDNSKVSTSEIKLPPSNLILFRVS